MTTIDLSIVIAATPDRVWPALADFGGVASWNPSVRTSRLTSTQEAGEGTSRECTLSPMGTVRERVLDWTEGRRMTIEIYEHRNVPALRSAEAHIELEPVAGGTQVRCRMEYSVGLGPLGAGMNALGMRRMFTRSLSGLLAGLKYHVETGRPVDGSESLDYAAVSSAA